MSETFLKRLSFGRLVATIVLAIAFVQVGRARSNENPAPQDFKNMTGVASFYNSYSRVQGYGPATINEAPLPSPPPPPSSQEYIYFGLPYANVIEGHTIGAEVAPDRKVSSWWQLHATYSYLHMSLRDNPRFSDVGNLLSTYLGSSPSSVADMQSLLDLPRGFELDATYRYSGVQREYTVPSYSTADLRFGWSWREGVALSLVVQNLLQPSHAEFGGDPGPSLSIKRAVYGKISWGQR